MSELIRKQHNVSILLYHIVCPAKYRKAVFTPQVDEKLKEICADIALRYEIEFLEIGADSDHVHFLVQSVPNYSPTKIVRTIKSITAKEIFRQMPEVKKQLWGGEFWSSGYYISTVGSHGTEEMLKQYVKNQGKSDEIIQLRLF
jgi:REP element-mobilizing transposase RayT